ncbi:MAG: SOS response-associated peptidase [Micromonosporaceae bacterium]
MCGRYASTRGATDLSVLFEAVDCTGDETFAANYNVAPTDPVYVVRHSASRAERVVEVARWGLLPPWATERRAGARMINARVETVRTSRAFRVPFARRRCLVPADGWYEWQRTDGGKQPYFLNPYEGGVLAFAGLWEMWGGAEARDGADRGGAEAPERLLTVTILTTAAVGELSEVHDRMPVALPASRWVPWLRSDPDSAERLLADPSWTAGIERRPVGAAVGDVRNNSAGLIQRVTAPIPAVNPVGPVDLTLF